MLTGYEQARSVVAAIAGDWDSAREVQLELPETGVCVTNIDGAACCGVGSGYAPLIQISASAIPVLDGEVTGCCG
jgi:hypothetical protein